jgi:hypothetical protein
MVSRRRSLVVPNSLAGLPASDGLHDVELVAGLQPARGVLGASNEIAIQRDRERRTGTEGVKCVGDSRSIGER